MKYCGKIGYSQTGKIYNIMLRRKDALRTLEEEKNAYTVSPCSVLNALQLINFVRFRKTFYGTSYKNGETTQSLYVFTLYLAKTYA